MEIIKALEWNEYNEVIDGAYQCVQVIAKCEVEYTETWLEDVTFQGSPVGKALIVECFIMTKLVGDDVIRVLDKRVMNVMVDFNVDLDNVRKMRLAKMAEEANFIYSRDGRIEKQYKEINGFVRKMW